MVSIGNKKCTHRGCTLAALHAAGGGAGPHEVCARHAGSGVDDRPIVKPVVGRKKRGPYRKRACNDSLATIEPNQGVKRGRSARATTTTTTTAAATTTKRTRVDDRRRDRAENTERSQSSAGRKGRPRSLRLLLQTDEDPGWAVLDWNWTDALVAAQSC